MTITHDAGGHSEDLLPAIAGLSAGIDDLLRRTQHPQSATDSVVLGDAGEAHMDGASWVIVMT